ncbi:MAG: hypothetical protein NTU74_13850 [Deltaproteobacteria bacterium]|nr:hypothetical protein [Deltaproteobacteria bacterium]
MQAVEKATGKKIEGVIENAIGRFSDTEITQFRQRVDDLWIEPENVFQSDPADGASGEPLPSDIETILSKAAGKLDEAPPEDRDEMVNLMEDIQDAARDNRLEDARAFAKELEEILFYIG